MAGEGRGLALTAYYPVTTRGLKSSESFEESDAALRFGTEGLEVQILSPRPLYKLREGMDAAQDRRRSPSRHELRVLAADHRRRLYRVDPVRVISGAR